MRKCPGVNASMPSSSHGKGARGLLLRQASTGSKLCVSFEGEFSIDNVCQVCLNAFDSSFS